MMDAPHGGRNPIPKLQKARRVACAGAVNVAVVLLCYCLTLLASILIEVSSISVVNASSTGNGFSMPR